MARETFSQQGSGTIPFTRTILDTDKRGTLAVDPEGHLGLGVMGGTNVTLINPEDLNSVDAFAVSGVSVLETSAVQIVSPNTNPLPRIRAVRIQNLGSTSVFVGPNSSVSLTNGYALEADPGDQTITLPILHNVEVWAISATAPNDVRILFY